MKRELQEKIYNKYPKIFKQKDLNMTQTCMCWGLEVGDGWYNIIDNLCEKIQNYVDTQKIEQVEAVQVKEKFGGLRFYIDNGNDDIDDMIDEAEEEANKTCEICGSREDIKKTQGWVRTLCSNCFEKKVT